MTFNPHYNLTIGPGHTGGFSYGGDSLLIDTYFDRAEQNIAPGMSQEKYGRQN
jgi:hypothetical protein